MLSRVAENLYWISRNVERAENVARLLDDAYHLELDAGASYGENRHRPLGNVLTILACRDTYQAAHPGSDDRDAILRFLAFDRSGPHSITSLIGLARENARGTQETLSSEAWGQLNQLYLYLNSARAVRRFSASPFRFFDRVKRECALFAALVDGTLPRGEVYHFLRLGRYLERVDMLGRILAVHCDAPQSVTADAAGEAEANSDPRVMHWAGLLRTCSAYEAYLKQFHDEVDPVNVVRFLVLGADFPRAMRFGVARCLESLAAIAGGRADAAAERRLGRLDGELRYMDPDAVFSRGLGPFLAEVQDACAAVSGDIHQAYFLV